MNNLNSSSPIEISKRYDALDLICDDIETQLQKFKQFVDEKGIYIRHKTTKIAKQLKKDNNELDGLVREQIRNSNERMMLMIQQQLEIQKQSYSRVANYFEQDSIAIKQMIDREQIQRQEEGNNISESLTADIAEIRAALQQTAFQCKARLQTSQGQLYNRTDLITKSLRQICETYSDNQSQFYKMLRDLVKKAKSQLECHKAKRQETETQILNLIDRMCDQTIKRSL